MLRSPPSRRRGLKLPNMHILILGGSSPPSRRRGLKFLNIIILKLEILVASFAEAWIEIGNPHCSSRCCYIVSSQR
mgnify:CR=1 FL=1